MKKICFVAFIMMMLRFGLNSQTVTFSHSGGFYENIFNLELTCNEAYHIRYTTNGATPTSASPLYEAPLTLNESLYSKSDIYTIQISPDNLVHVPDSVKHAIVIRAAAFDNEGLIVGDVVTNTYLIQELGCENIGIAVVSLCADSLDLFDYNYGIFVPGVHWSSYAPDNSGNYYQHGIEWERPANIEFYEPDDNSGINQGCGLRTHGNRSRRYPSKGMKIYAREDYGPKRFNHAFFDDTPMNSFNHLVFKPFASFWPYSGAQDYFGNRMAQHLDLDAPHCRPVLMYINGEYWGIYFIQEKTDEDFLADHHGVYPDRCNIIGDWRGSIDYGDNRNFMQMMQWFADTDLSDDNNYARACRIIDMNNFVDYYVFETFIGNWDWPGNNMRCWQEDNGPWRWIFFDGDATLMRQDFDMFANAAVFEPPITWNNYPETTLIFGKLLKNNQFRERFKARARQLCDGMFRYENTYPVVHDLIEAMRPRIGDQTHRFGYPDNEAYWDIGNDIIYTFLENRVERYLTALDTLDVYDVGELISYPVGFVCYPNPSSGKIHVNLIDNQLYTTNIQIYNAFGALVYDEPAQASLEIVLPSGIYLIKIANSTQRIIIQ